MKDDQIREPLNEPPIPLGPDSEGKQRQLNVNPLAVDGVMSFGDLHPFQKDVLEFNDLQKAKSDPKERQEVMMAWSGISRSFSSLGSYSSDENAYVIDIPPKTSKAMKAVGDYTLCHNHPTGTSFSLADWETAFRTNLKEIQAIGEYDGKSYLYVLKRPGKRWPNVDLANMFSKQEEESRAHVDIKRALGKVSEKDHFFQLRHDINSELSRLTGVKYNIYLVRR